MRVVVMGIGKSGLAAVRHFRRQGVTVAVSEVTPAERLDQGLVAALRRDGIELEAGGHTAAFLARADRIVVSPGVPLDEPALAAARAQGIPVAGELAVAAPLVTAPLVAVTGTNGKTTTCTLLGGLLAAAGQEVFVGGNIGTPLLEHVDGPRQAQVIVCEVSSFQL
ncbi:MAG: Mur ligase family protein, partial [Thermodesulfobacteriota bacterium]